MQISYFIFVIYSISVSAKTVCTRWASVCPIFAKCFPHLLLSILSVHVARLCRCLATRWSLAHGPNAFAAQYCSHFATPVVLSLTCLTLTTPTLNTCRVQWARLCRWLQWWFVFASLSRTQSVPVQFGWCVCSLSVQADQHWCVSQHVRTHGEANNFSAGGNASVPGLSSASSLKEAIGGNKTPFELGLAPRTHTRTNSCWLSPISQTQHWTLVYLESIRSISQPTLIPARDIDQIQCHLIICV